VRQQTDPKKVSQILCCEIYITNYAQEPFFTHRPVFGIQSDSEDGFDSQNEDDRPPATMVGKGNLAGTGAHCIDKGE
jgi:hypothetical protein